MSEEPTRSLMRQLHDLNDQLAAAALQIAQLTAQTFRIGSLEAAMYEAINARAAANIQVSTLTARVAELETELAIAMLEKGSSPPER